MFITECLWDFFNSAAVLAKQDHPSKVFKTSFPFHSSFAKSFNERGFGAFFGNTKESVPKEKELCKGTIESLIRNCRVL